ncbi:non-specific serine/threonine protein kinase [Trifolium repens]|nr:non-specific serine/threonine protein kinase [Trifolium repens]
MKKPPSSSSFNTHFTTVTIIIILYLSSSSNALGSGTTLSVIDSPATVCGITLGQSKQTIQCYRQGKIFSILPNVSFSSISGGRGYFCGLRSGNYSLHCWDISSSFQSKKLYVNDSVLLEILKFAPRWSEPEQFVAGELMMILNHLGRTDSVRFHLGRIFLVGF